MVNRQTHLIEDLEVKGLLYPEKFSSTQIELVRSAYIDATMLEGQASNDLTLAAFVGVTQSPTVIADLDFFKTVVSKCPWSLFTEYIEFGIPLPSEHFEIIVEGAPLGLTGSLSNVRRRRIMTLFDEQRDTIAIASHPSITIPLAVEIIREGHPDPVEALKANKHLSQEQHIMVNLIAASA